jgi:hypothetical protein
MSEFSSGSPEPGPSPPPSDTPPSPAAAQPASVWSPPGSVAPPVAPQPAEPPAPPPPPPPARSRAGLPKWLPYLLIAALPAILVGVLVFLFAGGNGGGGSDSSAAGVVDGFIRLGGQSQDVESFQKQVPTGFPKDIPPYPGAKIIVSFLIRSTDGNNYFVIYQTKDQPDAVVKYFQDKLDKDPWQVELAQAGSDFNGVRFSRPDDADVQGDLSVNRSDLDKMTTIYVSFQDLSPSNQSKPPSKTFVLPTSLELPKGFPADVPVFAGKKSPSTVTATYFERGAGGTNYLLTFLTKDDQGAVIDYYKSEFQKKGWTVTDSKPSASSFEVAIDFTDGTSSKLQGSIRADAFKDDAAYTQVDMLLQVSSSRGRGN